MNNRSGDLVYFELDDGVLLTLEEIIEEKESFVYWAAFIFCCWNNFSSNLMSKYACKTYYYSF